MELQPGAHRWAADRRRAAGQRSSGGEQGMRKSARAHRHGAESTDARAEMCCRPPSAENLPPIKCDSLVQRAPLALRILDESRKDHHPDPRGEGPRTPLLQREVRAALAVANLLQAQEAIDAILGGSVSGVWASCSLSALLLIAAATAWTTSARTLWGVPSRKTAAGATRGFHPLGELVPHAGTCASVHAEVLGRAITPLRDGATVRPAQTLPQVHVPRGSAIVRVTNEALRF